MAEPHHPSAETASAQQPVLIVHDEPNVRRLLVQVLAQRGVTHTSADSLATARFAMAEGGLRALITDLHLSDGSGLELLEAARGRFGPALPMALVTADYLADGRVLDRAAALGALVHIGILRTADLTALAARLLGPEAR